MRLILSLLLVFTGLTGSAAAQTVQRAELWNTEQFVLHSKILERDFLIQVAKPFGEVKGKVPAVYITDGNMLFMAAAAVAAANAGKDSTGPAYYIGIGYPEQDRDLWFKDRSAHLTHVDMKAKVPTGHGDKFAQFLIRELRPAIEARYPVDPARRMLAGYSFGGLFATRVLLDHPDAFDTYLLGSPSIWVEPALLDRAKAFSTPASPKRVFIAVGALEPPFMRTAELRDALSQPGNGVTVQYWSVPDENHMTVPPAFLARALRFALPPPRQ
ncbi:MAG TPA: alpha/beta hydrolase-fold protein [Sphingomonas sp.]|nr:alpha/beta hydrolase-fold protein [Sphingomonas sp.]